MMAREEYDSWPEIQLERRIEDEREACAKVCDSYASYQAALLRRENAAGRAKEVFALICTAELSAAEELARRIRSRT